MMKDKLRIFVDCHVFDGEFQGTRTYIKGLYLELLKEKSMHFFLAAYDTDALMKVFGEHENLTYVKYAGKNKIYRLLINTPVLIKKYKIDFAHFQYKVPPIKLCRYINTVHDVLFEDYPQYFPLSSRLLYHYTFKWSAHYSDIVLTVSKYSQERLQAHLGISSGITPNAVDDEFFEKYDKEAVQKEVFNKFGLDSYIIYISRWEPRKNHILALKAFVNLKLYKTHSLLFVGDETFKSAGYETYFEELSSEIKSKVIIMRRVEFKTMLLLLRASRASVYPSLAEGFGIPPLEALAAGIPTVISNATAMRDYDFMGRFAVNPANFNEFESRLKEIMEMEDLHEFETIKEKIRKQYNWPTTAQAYKAALSHYLNKNTAS